MKITREILGQKIEIELTQEEEQQIIDEHWKPLLSKEDAALALIEHANLYDPNRGADEFISRCMEEYSGEISDMQESFEQYWSNTSIDDEPFRSFFDMFFSDYEVTKKTRKYCVTVSRVTAAEIEVEAESEEQAEQIACDRNESEVEYEVVDGSFVVDDIREVKEKKA